MSAPERVIPLEELIRNLADHVAALSSRVERGTFQATRIANASEETNAMALTHLQETRASYEKNVKTLADMHEKLAVLLKKIEDAERVAGEGKIAAIESKNATEHLSGQFPLMPLDVEDTDKKLGKQVRFGWGLVRRIWPWVASTGAGATVGHLLHALHVLK